MVTKVLADVNICLDLLLDRKPHINFSGRIFELAEKSEITLYISGLSFDTLFYIMRPAIGGKKAIEKLQLLYSYTVVGEINASVIENALHSGWRDLEDALQYYCALQSGCTYLVTRNLHDFASDSDKLQVVKPEEFIKFYEKS
ncbi:MAG: type II toxin-antitoxin system VapC family toxin [Balneolaceae bacterium]